ncbi:hypothetical protein IU500_11020 [Nocardia terpenica]|uniref:hypothetical protein n=1 Tax=Nocardia terpenica TaxID=455432 RepID=UPI0018954163|nr:hypothetical protein [Nocardia terpenica]MBF6062486.1 hypothetical protein [Nocardia terpenica]MBF6104574.1 hypothetical protein [Nocardia terpenica]MBF6109571.1 hypothetical protein [Nocardia terpenica]MBF6119876.1 hypothetical protein [Nocardia terpenica]MBF6152287.1 hypothetical protein [Nocardia terpenica]
MPRNVYVDITVDDLLSFRPRTTKMDEPGLEIRRAWYATWAQAWEEWAVQRPNRSHVAEPRGWGRRALVWGWS